ncbi:MAG: hypothetical protein HQL96_07665 [Magnetococcales bacterium]|nr:hypothetical protein [Magnetococcales bacterium]
MEKRRIALAVLAGLVALRAGELPAFEVGEIAILNAPTQRFQAEIPLRLGESEEIKSVKVGKAVDYKVLGLNRAPLLDAIEASVQVTDKGPRILLTSREPLPQKTFDLLLQVSSSKHTNFPVFRIKPEPSLVSPKQEEAAAPVIKPAANAGLSPDKVALPGGPDVQPEETRKEKASKSAKKPAERQEKTPPTEEKKPEEKKQEEKKTATATVKEPPPASAEEAPVRSGERARLGPKPLRYGPVREGENLTSIANALRQKGVSTFQIMVAIFERNSDHFLASNMNNLISGGVLNVPTLEEIRSIKDREARIQTMAHLKIWKQTLAGQSVAPPPATSFLPPIGQQTAPEVSAPASSVAAPGEPAVRPVPSPGLENILMQLQAQLGELTQVLRNNQAQQAKMDARLTALENNTSGGEQLANRIAVLEQALRERGAVVEGSGEAVAPEGAGRSATVAMILGGVVFVFGLLWLGRRWNRQAQWSNLQQFLNRAAQEHPNMVEEALRKTEPHIDGDYMPNIRKGEVLGASPQGDKKVVTGDVRQNAERLSALETQRS